MTKKKITKKQITFAVSVFAAGLSAVGLFLHDVVVGLQENGGDIVNEVIGDDYSQVGEIIHSFGENLGSADFQSWGDIDESGIENISDIDTTGKIVRVVDGDTYCIDLADVDGDEEKGTKVRIIGVDTPESVAPDSYRKDNTEEGKTVSDVVKDKLKAGDTVFIEYDVQKNDRYGRTLAYVYFSDGKMVEDWLLSEGLANVATYAPNVKYSEHFQELAHKAWESKVGLWADFYTEEPTTK